MRSSTAALILAFVGSSIVQAAPVLAPIGLNLRSDSLIHEARGFDASPASSFLRRRAEEADSVGNEKNTIDKREPENEGGKKNKSIVAERDAEDGDFREHDIVEKREPQKKGKAKKSIIAERNAEAGDSGGHGIVKKREPGRRVRKGRALVAERDPENDDLNKRDSADIVARFVGKRDDETEPNNIEKRDPKQKKKGKGKNAAAAGKNNNNNNATGGGGGAGTGKKAGTGTTATTATTATAAGGGAALGAGLGSAANTSLTSTDTTTTKNPPTNSSLASTPGGTQATTQGGTNNDPLTANTNTTATVNPNQSKQPTVLLGTTKNNLTATLPINPEKTPSGGKGPTPFSFKRSVEEDGSDTDDSLKTRKRSDEDDDGPDKRAVDEKFRKRIDEEDDEQNRVSKRGGDADGANVDSAHQDPAKRAIEDRGIFGTDSETGPQQGDDSSLA